MKIEKNPSVQRQGIGCALVEAGLKECSVQGYGGVVVLGHPKFYTRFGFKPASVFGLSSEFDVPDEAFMAQELRDSYLEGASGLIQCHSFFQDV